MQERIDEILALIDEQLSLVADNYIESSYKAIKIVKGGGVE